MGYNKERYRTLKNIAYHILFGVWYVVSCLPMWFLYAISSFVSAILFYVIRYRRKVVHQNIKESYPALSDKERWKIERRFYVYFCDILMESVKFFSISEKEIRKRMQFKGLELLEDSCRRGKSCGFFLGHYGNWEWISSIPLWLDPKIGKCTQLYHPLENYVTDRLISYTRERFGSTNIPTNESIRHFVKYRKEGRPILVGFIADQAPFWSNIYYWTSFLNHPETPVFTGAERIMKKFDMDVYYMDVQRVSRGHYVVECKLITTKPNDCEDFYLTETYTRMLEETINRAPAYWLWSHRRWKRTKEDWLRITEGGLKLGEHHAVHGINQM